MRLDLIYAVALLLLVSGPVAADGAWSWRDEDPGEHGNMTRMSLPGGVFELSVDMARIVTFDRPAATIVLGNDDIMEATLLDDQSVVLTGRSPGRTNVLVFDAQREPIFERDVEVVEELPRVITVRRGGNREILLCAPEGSCSLTDFGG